ncbi:MAG: hypothetical protein PVF12_04890 [Thiohalocapsa sp.]
MEVRRKRTQLRRDDVKPSGEARPAAAAEAPAAALPERQGLKRQPQPGGVDEQRRRAELEARRAEEEARRLAEQEEQDRLRAEEEARRRADDEARKRRETEERARRDAEEIESAEAGSETADEEAGLAESTVQPDEVVAEGAAAITKNVLSARSPPKRRARRMPGRSARRLASLTTRMLPRLASSRARRCAGARSPASPSSPISISSKSLRRRWCVR